MRPLVWGGCESGTEAGRKQQVEQQVAMSGTGAVLTHRYRLREKIGAGGVGQVWRAADEVLGREVAVKLLRPEYADHPETLLRFRAEARLAARLVHPGVVQVYDYGQAGVPFLVMELVEGPSLADVLAEGPLRPSWVLSMIGQVAAGLSAAHAAGLIHRDIKPANLLLAPDGLVKITDFGIASAAGSAPLTSTGMLAGTPGYLAPERVAGATAGPASDLYSLGVVAWECLTGTPPFTGTPVEIALAHAHRDLPPLPAEVPAQLAGLIGQLTAKDPAARPASAAAVAARVGTSGIPVTADVAALSGRPAAEAPGPPQATLMLAGITEYDTPSPYRWPGHLARKRRTALLTVAGVIAAAGISGLLVAVGSGIASSHPASTSTTSGQMVTVDGAALDGQPAAAVLAQLRQAGLRPHLLQQSDDHAQPGTVITVEPAGQVPVGATVTVVAAFGHHHHDGKGSGDNGNGG